MRASTQSDIKRSIVECGWSARRPMADYIGVIDRVVGAGGVFRRAGSGALGIAYVADGRAEGYCELHINSWDALAGIVMVTEAGGWVNDFLANDGMSKGNAVLCTGPAIKDSLIALTGIR